MDLLKNPLFVECTQRQAMTFLHMLTLREEIQSCSNMRFPSVLFTAQYMSRKTGWFISSPDLICTRRGGLEGKVGEDLGPNG